MDVVGRKDKRTSAAAEIQQEGDNETADWNLLRLPDYHRAPVPSSKTWVPRHIYDPPKGQTQEERILELQKLEPAPNLSQERGNGRNRTRPRKTVDYFSGLDRWRILRKMRRRTCEDHIMRPNPNSIIDLLAPAAYADNCAMSICAKYVHTSMNKLRCPVNVVRWTTEGRRVMTGSTSGEFTMWNGLTFNFETILQAHDNAVRCAEWSNSGIWLVSADSGGIIKYFQNNMNNLQAFQGHGEAIRDVSFAPNDARFVTGADDSTIKIWSFEEMREERTLTGHGWDVKCVKWHPTKGLLASGSKDNMVKFWDPRTGRVLTTLHGHRNTVQALSWNPNGNSVATASRDSYVKVYDIRAMNELCTFKGHKKEACSLAWHPFNHSYLVSGGSEGSILHWSTESVEPTPLETLEFAHDSNVWSLAFHPLGHILASASNDHTTRFWTRSRPGGPRTNLDRFHIGKDQSKELGNKLEDDDDDDFAVMPGLGSGPAAPHAMLPQMNNWQPGRPISFNDVSNRGPGNFGGSMPPMPAMNGGDGFVPGLGGMQLPSRPQWNSSQQQPAQQNNMYGGRGGSHMQQRNFNHNNYGMGAGRGRGRQY